MLFSMHAAMYTRVTQRGGMRTVQAATRLHKLLAVATSRQLTGTGSTGCRPQGFVG